MNFRQKRMIGMWRHSIRQSENKSRGTEWKNKEGRESKNCALTCVQEIKLKCFNNVHDQIKSVFYFSICFFLNNCLCKNWVELFIIIEGHELKIYTVYCITLKQLKAQTWSRSCVEVIKRSPCLVFIWCVWPLRAGSYPEGKCLRGSSAQLHARGGAEPAQWKQSTYWGLLPRGGFPLFWLLQGRRGSRTRVPLITHRGVHVRAWEGRGGGGCNGLCFVAHTVKHK